MVNLCTLRGERNREATMKKSKLEGYRGALRFEFPELNGEEKLRELILYISDQCFDDPFFGATKLNKILYNADFQSFKRTGKPITGIQYQRLDEGPAPKRLLPVHKEMQENKEIVVKTKRMLNDKDQKRTIALREPNLDLFSASEIAIVDEVIRKLWGKTAKQVSLETHGISWEVYEDKELMAYESVHLSDEVTFGDMVRAHELIEKHGWTDVQRVSS